MTSKRLAPGAALHEENCERYLAKLPTDLSSVFNAEEHSQFNKLSSASARYTFFLEALEAKLALTPEDKDLQAIAYAVYHNDNRNLGKVYEAIEDVVFSQRPAGGLLEERINRALKNTLPRSPYAMGSKKERFKALMSDNYKPQHTTSLATLRHYAWQPDNMTEYRMPTQAQRHAGKVRVSPMFQAFLKSEEMRSPDSTQVTHVYFNFLRRDARKKTLQERLFGEKQKECAMTAALEGLETHNKNLAVITLPADEGLMQKNDYQNTQRCLTYEEMETQFLGILSEDESSCLNIRDFHVSGFIRDKLFGSSDKNEQKSEISDLITQAFFDMGVKKNRSYSPATRQAVWFHVVNYLIPKLAIQTLQPKGYNFSCKDAIDRGGVASAWYNLMASFKTGNPMSYEEFSEALYAAPAMVKGRGMNHHHHRLWNAVNSYVTAHHENLRKDATKAWLIHWRNRHCPKARFKEVFKQTLNQTDTQKKEMQALVNELKQHEPRPWMLHALSTLNYSQQLQAEGKALPERELIAYKTLLTRVRSPKYTILKGLLIGLLGLFSEAKRQTARDLISLGLFGRKHSQLLEAVAPPPNLTAPSA